MGAIHSPLIKNWEIQIHTWPRKIIAITIVLVTCGVLIYKTWWLFLAAWITRSGPPYGPPANPLPPAIYERAIRYDPKNADYYTGLLGRDSGAAVPAREPYNQAYVVPGAPQRQPQAPPPAAAKPDSPVAKPLSESTPTVASPSPALQ